MSLPSATPLPVVSARAALLTPPGRGAVAVIALEADPAELPRLVDPCWQPRTPGPWAVVPLGVIRAGGWGVTSPEEVVAIRLTPSRTEWHCHGGTVAPQRLLSDLADRGALVVDWKELVAAAGPQTGGCPDLQATLALALAAAITEQAAARLHEQCLQHWPRALTQWRTWLAQPADHDQLQSAWRTSLQWAPWGLHLTTPWRVVLCGRPNAGKSSVLNALMGFQRSIVSEQPGTTRDLVGAMTAFAGWPCELIDSAGLRQTDAHLEQQGIERAEQAIASADLRLWVVDASLPEDLAEADWLARWPQSIVIANKSDLPTQRTTPWLQHTVALSALTGEGIERLSAQIAGQLVSATPPTGVAVPVSQAQCTWLKWGIELLERNQPAELAELAQSL